MSNKQLDRQLAAARQDLAEHLKGCEICDLAVRERPGASLCLEGKRLHEGAEELRRVRDDGQPVGGQLSIGDQGVEQED